MRIISLISRYIAIFLISIIFAVITTSVSLTGLYKTYFPDAFNWNYAGGFDINFANIDNAFVGILISFTIFLFTLLISAGERSRYWIVLVLAVLVPAVEYRIFWTQGISTSLMLVTIGITTGFALRFLISKTIGATAQGASLKKYF